MIHIKCEIIIWGGNSTLIFIKYYLFKWGTWKDNVSLCLLRLLLIAGCTYTTILGVCSLSIRIFNWIFFNGKLGDEKQKKVNAITVETENSISSGGLLWSCSSSIAGTCQPRQSDPGKFKHSAFSSQTGDLKYRIMRIFPKIEINEE